MHPAPEASRSSISASRLGRCLWWFLVTGFEPFGADGITIMGGCASLAKARGKRRCCGGVRAPLCRCRWIVEELIEREQPDAVLCAGVAAGRAQVTPSMWPSIIVTRALRITKVPAVRRACGCRGSRCLLGFRTVYAMAKACCDLAVSYSAGTYCCNDLFYSVRHFCAAALSRRAGRLHSCPAVY